MTLKNGMYMSGQSLFTNQITIVQVLALFKFNGASWKKGIPTLEARQ
jgi:hypothetical protein